MALKNKNNWQVSLTNKMSTTNFTEQYEKFYDLPFCSAGSVAGFHKDLICLAAFNIVLAIAAVVGNTLILIALHKEISLHPPSKVLLRNLAVTDLCVGIIAQPSHVAFWLSLLQDMRLVCRFANIVTMTVSTILCGVSLSTTSAISVDRLLALLMRLRYRQVVNLKRVYVAVIGIWVCSICTAIMSQWLYTVWLILVIIFTSLCLSVSVYSYTRIFLRMRYHQSQVRCNAQEQANQTISLNITRYRKTVSTAMWVQLAMVACYLPYIVVLPYSQYGEERRIGQSLTLDVAVDFASTLIFFNSSLNPILYCWKIKEVRRAVKDTLRQLLSLQNR